MNQQSLINSAWDCVQGTDSLSDSDLGHEFGTTALAFVLLLQPSLQPLSLPSTLCRAGLSHAALLYRAEHR